jgi:hypothetical protein
MKTVLWKPFQRWSGSLYSNYRSSNRGSNNDKSKVELTSQDPIVDSNEPSGGYRLNSIDLAKPSSPGELEEERYPSRIERTLARLPSTHYPPRYGKDSKNTSPSGDEFTHSKLEISKETNIQISSMTNEDDANDQQKDHVIALPRAGNRTSNSKPSNYKTSSNSAWD